MATGLAVAAGFGVAVTANLLLFRACQSEPCPERMGMWVAYAPGLLAMVAAAWFVARVATRATAIPAVLCVLLMLIVSGAPFVSNWPLTRSSLPPGAFGAFRVAIGAFTVLAAPLILFWAFPFVLWSVGWTVVFAWPNREPRRVRRWHAVAAAALLVSGALGEFLNAPAAWSPAVRRRIANVDLPAHPAALAFSDARGSTKQHRNYRVPESVSAADVLDFYSKVFDGWFVVDRTYQDEIWLDPTATVFAWVYLAPLSTGGTAAPGPRLVYATLQDVDRARWQHGRRRTSHGDRIVDVIRDRTLTR
jgi:hypothetical protein